MMLILKIGDLEEVPRCLWEVSPLQRDIYRFLKTWDECMTVVSQQR